MEYSRGLETHNIVTVVMHERKLGYEGAMEWLATFVKQNVTQFLEDRKRLPSWGEDIDRQLKTYVDALGYSVRGYDSWSFESPRYFGAEGKAVQEHRWVTLQPLGR